MIDEFMGIKLVKESDLIQNTSKESQLEWGQDDFEAVLRELLSVQDKLFVCDEPNHKQELKAQLQSLKDMIVEEQLRYCSDEIKTAYGKATKTSSKPFTLWHLDFARVFRTNGGFDIVIGNPPYVSSATQMLDENLLKNRNAIIESKKFTTLYSKWDLYIPFMEMGIRMLCNDGAFTMIVPYPLTNQIYAKKLREFMHQENDIIELVDLQDTKVFEATVQNCIPFVIKRAPRNSTIISGFVDGKITKKFVQTTDRLIQDSKTYVWNLSEEEHNSSKHKNMHTLGDFFYISKGMVLHSNENVAREPFKKTELISLTADELHPKMYIEGKDIDKYQIKRIRYLEWDTERSPRALSRPTFEELYTSPKLLFNCLGEMKVAVDLVGELYCEQSIRVAVLWKDIKGVTNNSISGVVKKYSNHSRTELEELSRKISLKYVLGIMNSSYGAVLLADMRGGDYHIVPEHLRGIPIPIAEKDIQLKIESIVDKLLIERTPELITELDTIVAALYSSGEE